MRFHPVVAVVFVVSALGCQRRAIRPPQPVCGTAPVRPSGIRRAHFPLEGAARRPLLVVNVYGTDTTARPLSYARVTAQTETEPRRWLAFSANPAGSGRYVLADSLTAGEYVVLAMAPGYAFVVDTVRVLPLTADSAVYHTYAVPCIEVTPTMLRNER